MIYTILVFIGLIIVGGLTWFAWDQIVSAVYTTVSTNFPSLFTGSWVTFMDAIWYWMLLILVLFGGLLYVWVQSQKPVGYEY